MALPRKHRFAARLRRRLLAPVLLALLSCPFAALHRDHAPDQSGAAPAFCAVLLNTAVPVAGPQGNGAGTPKTRPEAGASAANSPAAGAEPGQRPAPARNCGPGPVHSPQRTFLLLRQLLI